MTGAEIEIINPITGELIDIRETAKVADVVEQLRDVQNSARDAIGAITRALIEESQRVGTKTFAAGKVAIVLSADSEIQWDVTELIKLRDAGLPEERYADLVEEVVSYKVNGAVARSIASANDAYAEIIEKARVKVPKKQYVSIKPR